MIVNVSSMFVIVSRALATKWHMPAKQQLSTNQAVQSSAACLHATSCISSAISRAGGADCPHSLYTQITIGSLRQSRCNIVATLQRYSTIPAADTGHAERKQHCSPMVVQSLMMLSILTAERQQFAWFSSWSR